MVGTLDYTDVEGDFYDAQCASPNPVRSWFHTSRHKLVKELVEKYYQGGKIVDVGCGACLWNTNKLPVIGLDVNKALLEKAKTSGRLQDYYLGEVQDKHFNAAEFSFVVSSEFIEHCIDYADVIHELNRMLKVGGRAVITVPYDTNLSLWKPLFTLQCFIQGTLKGDEYYKKECGHVNHFSPKSLSLEFEKNGFKVLEFRNHAFFTIALAVEKVK